jgi:hypothetical protein
LAILFRPFDFIATKYLSVIWLSNVLSVPHVIWLSNVLSIPHVIWLSNVLSVPHVIWLSNVLSVPHVIWLSNVLSVPHEGYSRDVRTKFDIYGFITITGSIPL